MHMPSTPSGPTDQPDDQPDERPQLEAVKEAVGQMDWQQAAPHLNPLLASTEHATTELYLLAAQVEALRGNVEQALMYAQDATWHAILPSGSHPLHKSECDQIFLAFLSLGHRYSEAAIHSQTTAEWQGHLEEAIQSFKTAQKVQPGNASIAFRLAFLHYQLGDTEAAWLATLGCNSVYYEGAKSLTGVPIAPQYLMIQGLICVLEHELDSQQRMRLTDLDGPLVAFYQEHALQWLSYDIIAKGPLQWQNHEMLIALPALAESEYIALMMQTIRGRCHSKPADWIPSPLHLVDSAISNLSEPKEQQPDKACNQDCRCQAVITEKKSALAKESDLISKKNLATSMVAVITEKESALAKDAKRPLRNRKTERDMLEAAFGIQVDSRFDLCRPLASALGQDLGWLPSEPQLLLPEPGFKRRHDANALKVEQYLHTHKGLPVERIQAAMLLPDNVEVKGLAARGRNDCQLIFRGPSGLETSITGPPMPKRLRRMTAKLFLQSERRHSNKHGRLFSNLGTEERWGTQKATKADAVSGPVDEVHQEANHRNHRAHSQRLHQPDPKIRSMNLRKAGQLIGVVSAHRLQKRFASRRQHRRRTMSRQQVWQAPRAWANRCSALCKADIHVASMADARCRLPPTYGSVKNLFCVPAESYRWQAATSLTGTPIPCNGHVQHPSKLGRRSLVGPNTACVCICCTFLWS